jgi:dGTPase
MYKFREGIEERENKYLAAYATKSSESIGRTLHGNEIDPYRTCFQRDRDRILYSTAFKRLQYKTQVYLTHEGDFYRTRLTHTLEVVQHAKTFARIFRVNEDLCEAIGLAHDLGHAPFGHAGEKTLNEIMKKYGGFEHNFQSLRIVDQLEKRYPKYDGLNLCYETREGLARHTTHYDNPNILKEFKKFPFPSLEAQIVNISDPLAFCAHDLEDALAAGFIESYSDLGKLNLAFIEEIIDKVKRETSPSQDNLIKNRIFVRNLIEHLSIDVFNQTIKNINKFKIKNVADVRSAKHNIVDMSPKMGSQFKKLFKYFENEVYHSPQVLRMNEKGKMIIENLFNKFDKTPKILPKRTYNRYEKAQTEADKKKAICDFISGMTDKYAMDFYQQLFEPYERVIGVERSF